MYHDITCERVPGSPLLTFHHHLSLGARLAVSFMVKACGVGRYRQVLVTMGGPQQYSKDAKTFMNAFSCEIFQLE